MTPENAIDILPEEHNPAWLPERLERAKRAALQTLLDEVGYPDVESLKATLQTQTEQLAQLTNQRDDLTAQLATAQTARQQAYLDAAFIAEASRYRFINPEEARLLLDWSQVAVQADNSVTGLQEAMLTLVKARPHLLRPMPVPQIDAGAQTPPLPRIQGVGDLSPDQVEALKKRFKLW